jgi:hypothetical protein
MKIIPLESLSHDDRGYVGEYYHDRAGRHLLVFCNAGAIRGRHYHKGLSPTKNPEIIILVSGKCTINWRNLDTSTMSTETITGPAKMQISANTWHEFVAQTDCSFLELNSIAEHKSDTFYLD